MGSIDQRPRDARRHLVWFTAGLVVLAILLAWHAWTYRFLTDDAFISFRYAHNLVAGQGLVFNPGERVEGYTNFLWVLALGVALRFGWEPVSAAVWFSAGATALLWVGAALWGWRQLGVRRAYLALLAPLALATHRSFAVWSTSGLETRLFELLILGGLAATWAELQRPRRVPWSSLWFVLAVWTRPDATVVAVGAMLGREWVLWRRGAFRRRDAVLRGLAFLVPLGLHEAWRLAYYGQPLPNTYYAKLDGELRFAQGGQYAAFFAVEYALLLWLPFLAEGVRGWRRNAPGLATIILGGLVPYLAYVIAAGGDHFEFRPLDVMAVPLALLLQAGVAHRTALTPARRGRALLFAAAAFVVAASTLLPALSHRDFPAGYRAGFPGMTPRDDGSRDLVRAAAMPSILRVVVLPPWLDSYNHLARSLTERYVGLRQEEHLAFVRGTISAGRALRRHVENGDVPSDARIALDCVGAMPYYSGLWCLDRLGLCDVNVAHGPWMSGQRLMAHGKMATAEYVASQRVDLEAVHAFNFFLSDAAVRESLQQETPARLQSCLVARLAPNVNFLAHFPLGRAHGLERFPRLRFEPASSWQPASPPPSAAGGS
jgi:hypothetical protein